MERPRPVPAEVERRLAVIELHVARRELLTADPGAKVTAVEDKVRHEAARAVLHEDALLLVRLRGVLPHVKLNVLQRRGLGDLPVNARAPVGWLLGDVDDEVANLTEEVVLVGEPVVLPVVRVRVDNRHPLERRVGLEDGPVEGVTDELESRCSSHSQGRSGPRG